MGSMEGLTIGVMLLYIQLVPVTASWWSSNSLIDHCSRPHAAAFSPVINKDVGLDPKKNIKWVVCGGEGLVGAFRVIPGYPPPPSLGVPGKHLSVFRRCFPTLLLIVFLLFGLMCIRDCPTVRGGVGVT